MTCPSELAAELRNHLGVCGEILALLERENHALRREESRGPLEDSAPRKKFLAKLTDSLDRIRHHRVAWLRLEPAARQEYPEIAELLRENQNLLMKILVLDRENEQMLLRKGLVPNRQIPSAQRQRPHFVASLYQRNSAV